MRAARDIEHSIVFKDPHSYCAHPHTVAAADEWIVVFNRAPRRTIVLHPPEDPEFQNFITRSPDEGVTWSAPEVVPGYGWHGVECAGLTALASGEVMLNQWRFNWYPLSLARRMETAERLSFPDEFMSTWAASPEHSAVESCASDFEKITPWARGEGNAYVHFSSDRGRSFGSTRVLRTAPMVGGYGIRGAVEVAPGQLVLPLSDVPLYRTVFVLRSSDGGRNWAAPVVAAEGSGHAFEEPAMLHFGDGRLVMLVRDNITRRLHRVFSVDGGTNWTPAEPLPINGYPPHLLALPDERVLCTYGFRRHPFGIRAALSRDGARSFDAAGEIAIRTDCENRNLGYPVTLVQTDGRLATIYYAEDEGVTSILMTRWSLPCCG
jgi:BNR repeat-like domain